MNAASPVRINLLAHRALARRRRQRQFVLCLAGGAVSGLLLALLAGAGIHAVTAAHQQRVQGWRAASARLDAGVAAVRRSQRETGLLAARQRSVAQLQAQRNDWVLLLAALARAVPAGVTLHGLRQQGTQVCLEGRAQVQEQVAQLLDALALALPQSQPQLLEVRAAQAAGVELALQLQWPPAACVQPGATPC